MTTPSAILGCHLGDTPATIRAMSVTPIMDNVLEALYHAVETGAPAPPGYVCIPEIHVSAITWRILGDEFEFSDSVACNTPKEPGVLGYLNGYEIKPLKYGQGWTIIYREIETPPEDRMI